VLGKTLEQKRATAICYFFVKAHQQSAHGVCKKQQRIKDEELAHPVFSLLEEAYRFSRLPDKPLSCQRTF